MNRVNWGWALVAMTVLASAAAPARAEVPNHFAIGQTGPVLGQAAAPDSPATPTSDGTAPTQNPAPAPGTGDANTSGTAPPPAAAPALDGPAPAAVPTPLSPSEVDRLNHAEDSAPRMVYKKKHPYGLLIGGAVAFVLPYIATVVVAALNADYNPNSTRLGYIPVAGPLLARAKINDKDLGDGYNPGLITDGVVQIVAANLLVAGIIYCAVGQKVAVVEQPRATMSWTPVVAPTSNGGYVGAVASW